MTGFQERFVPVPDGLKLFVRDYPAQGAAPLLVVHGAYRPTASPQ